MKTSILKPVSLIHFFPLDLGVWWGEFTYSCAPRHPGSVSKVVKGSTYQKGDLVVLIHSKSSTPSFPQALLSRGIRK